MSRNTRSLRTTITPAGDRTTGRLRTIQLNSRSPAGTAFPESAPSEEAVRRFVLCGVCPFCGQGPFKVLAGHTVRAHAVDRKELRDLAGLTYQTSICDPQVSEERAARSKALYDEGRSGIGTEEARAKARTAPRSLSAAAKRLNAEKIRSIPPEDRVANAKKASDVRTAGLAEQHTEVLRLLDEGLTFAQVGESVGIWASSVSAIAKRYGRNEDGRARYHRSRRGVDSPTLAAGREKHQANLESRRRDALAAYADQGLDAAAERLGVSAKQARAFLRKHGATVPDGRRQKVTPMVTFVCPECGSHATRPAAQVRSNHRAGWNGPHCSRSCAAKARMRKRLDASGEAHAS